jgi:hypothetical protein
MSQVSLSQRQINLHWISRWAWKNFLEAEIAKLLTQSTPNSSSNVIFDRLENYILTSKAVELWLLRLD